MNANFPSLPCNNNVIKFRCNLNHFWNAEADEDEDDEGRTCGEAMCASCIEAVEVETNYNNK